ncbi:MAG: winged helix-turn-helix transcriptional regulator [Vulcanimicrobiaceae bacterium]
MGSVNPDPQTQLDPRACPVHDAVATIADKWKLLILFELARNPVLRFKELQRAVGEVSPKVLTSSLRALEADGFIERSVFPEVPPRVEYRATEAVHELLPILVQLQQWARDHSERLATIPEKAGRRFR